MPSHDAFLKEITANPEDLTPRLVYADWLDEQGDPRGEFIRVQCELATLDETDDRYPALLRRERELLAEHRSEWLRPLKPYIRSGTFRCGFVERVRVRLSTFLSEGEQLSRMTPLRTVAFTSASGHQVLPQLPASSVLKQLAGLEFHSFRGINELFPTLARFPELPKLRRLVISQKESINLAKSRQLFRSPLCAHLNGLILPENNLQAYCLDEIARSELCLKQLDLSSNRQIRKGVDFLANWCRLSQIESLNLNQCDLPTEALYALMKSPGLGRLKHLALGYNNFYDHGNLQLIANNPSMSQLTALGLANCPANADDIVALTQSPHLTSMRRLDLALGNDYDASLILLSQWPRLAQIRHLRLAKRFGFHALGDEDLERIVRSKYWSKDAILSITPFNADFIRRTRESTRRQDGYSYDLGNVPMGYLHDPVGVF